MPQASAGLILVKVRVPSLAQSPMRRRGDLDGASYRALEDSRPSALPGPRPKGGLIGISAFNNCGREPKFHEIRSRRVSFYGIRVRGNR